MTESPKIINKKAWRFKRWALYGAAVVLALIGFTQLRQGGPSFEGKSVDQWFNIALSEAQANAYTTPTTNRPSAETARLAFAAMEGDAIPFLEPSLELRPTAWDKGYAKLFAHTPTWIRTKLSRPRDDWYYEARRECALKLLALIGKEQRFKSDTGHPSSKIPISVAISQINKTLTNIAHNSYSSAAMALRDIGPPAAPAIPSLIEIAGQRTNYWSTPIAIEALGAIGPSASNAVDLLIEIGDSSSAYREKAIRSLGAIGLSSESVLSVLCARLNEINYPMKIAAAKSLGEIGVIPESAWPTLTTMREKPDPLLPNRINVTSRIAATFALWISNPADEQMRTDLSQALLSNQKKWLLSSMIRVGPKANIFAPEFLKLTEDDDPEVKRLAKVALVSTQASTQ